MVELKAHKLESKVHKLDVNQSTDGSLGQLLLDTGVLTESDVERILKYADKKGLRFGAAAVKLRIVKKADVEHALAQQFDYPYLKAGVGGFGKELVAAYQPFTRKVEQLRKLRMQLKSRWFAAGNSSLAIVSPGRKDGRTYLAANLAIVFSQLGERTLLVDADLRNSRLHEVFQVKNAPGLSPALVGRTAGNVLVLQVPHFKNLRLLPAGPPPPNPDELLARNEYEEILRQVSQAYDVVLIDTPPGNTGTGSETVALRCGGALMVARRNKTSMDAARAFVRRLESQAEIVGSVLSTF